jgi:signal peptidase II
VTLKAILYDWGGANLWLFQAIQLQRPGPLDEVMEWVSRMGSYWNLPLVAGSWLVVAILLRHEDSALAPPAVRQLKRLLVGAAIAFAVTAGLKLALDFPRPAAVLTPGTVHVVGTGERGYSLPSGHASFSALLAASLWPLLGPWGRGAAVLLVLAVGLSRVWLGAHFPADVAAGYLVGLASAVLAVFVGAWRDVETETGGRR